MSRPTCKVCGRNPCQSKGYRRYADGSKKRIWRIECSACYDRKLKGLPGPAQPKPVAVFDYRSVKGTSCELCGFVAQHPAQLDVDHKDGNCRNDDLSNLWTLCANCHRLKTMEAGDHLTPAEKASLTGGLGDEDGPEQVDMFSHFDA